MFGVVKFSKPFRQMLSRPQPTVPDQSVEAKQSSLWKRFRSHKRQDVTETLYNFVMHVPRPVDLTLVREEVPAELSRKAVGVNK